MGGRKRTAPPMNPMAISVRPAIEIPSGATILPQLIKRHEDQSVMFVSTGSRPFRVRYSNDCHTRPK